MIDKQYVMTLSKQVTESLDDAAGHIRNALAFAARHERPVTISAIGRLLNDVESLQTFDSLMDTIEEHVEDINTFT
jgi:chromosomal replication initiation ATPase DnaA|tara:strand:- start:4003 stop:4230 length:228 start_codon:yes stop_codon:yes gene_type:complete